MRTLNILNLVIVMTAAFFTWSAVASAAPAVKVHVLQNLTDVESKEVQDSLSKMGYAPSKKSLFSESKNAIIITKALPTETESASISIEMVQLENEKSIPKTLFKYKLEGNDVQAMLKSLPNAEAFSEAAVMPVAFQKTE